MRRMVIAAVVVAGLVSTAAPAGAAGGGASFCSNAGVPSGTLFFGFGSPGGYISDQARVVGHNAEWHPGPVVPYYCRPAR